MKTTDAPAVAPTTDQTPAAPRRNGPGAMLMGTLGVAALAPALIAQSLPATRRTDLVDTVDSSPSPLRPLDHPTLVVVEPVTGAGADPESESAENDAVSGSDIREGRRAQRKANRQAGRRANAAAALPETDAAAATVGADLLDAPATSASASSADLSPEAAATRTARRAQRKVARRDATAANGGAVTLIVPELPAGANSQTAMIDHVAKLTMSLGQAHRLIHTLSVEKFEVQKELALLKNEPAPETITLPQAANRRGKAVRPERARRGKNAPVRDGEQIEEASGPIDEAAFMEAKQVARQRQFMALSVVAAIAIFALMYNYMDWHWFPNIGDRQALSSIAYIGGFVQIFFMGWMFFRFARIGGKGARWLFPSEEDQIKQVRRKKQNEAQKAQLAQIKERRKGTGGDVPSAPKRDAATA